MPILQDVSNNLTSHTDRNPDMGCTWELVAMPGHDKDLGILPPNDTFRLPSISAPSSWANP